MVHALAVRRVNSAKRAMPITYALETVSKLATHVLGRVPVTARIGIVPVITQNARTATRTDARRVRINLVLPTRIRIVPALPASTSIAAEIALLARR